MLKSLSLWKKKNRLFLLINNKNNVVSWEIKRKSLFFYSFSESSSQGNTQWRRWLGMPRLCRVEIQDRKGKEDDNKTKELLCVKPSRDLQLLHKKGDCC